ncbi:MAG TPA: tetratricopeptide repeat protein, partial [Chryseolinea sp.]|nr:tetratricopeptide repeat protein [Chryseolinea sp.]
ELGSPKRVHPSARFNIGISLSSLDRLDEAIVAFEKAELDSPEGKYPEASFNKGVTFAELNKDEEAIASFEKAELDSAEGKYPRASSNKGISLKILGWSKEAIDAFEKAEQNGPKGKCPEASYNKGIALESMGQYEQALTSYQKAVRDAQNNFKPDALLNIASIYSRIFGNFVLSATYCTKALLQDAYDTDIVKFMLDSVVTPFHQRIYYKNRLEYLYLLVEEKLISKGNYDSKKEYIQNFWENSKNHNHLKTFCAVLCSKQIEIPLPLSFDNRLRLAYIIYYKDQPWYAYHIIDSLLSEEFVLNDMDIFFYLSSAWKIAEPKSKIISISKNNVIERANPFALKFTELANQIRDAQVSKNHHDEYLLNIEYELKIDLNAVQCSPLIRDALTAAIDPTISYLLPFKEYTLVALENMMLLSIDEVANANQFKNNYAFDNFSNSFSKQDTLNYELVVHNIRDAISKGTPYLLILNEIFKQYQKSTDVARRNNLIILQACVLISNHFDARRKPVHKNSNVVIASGCTVDLLAHKTVGLFVACGAISDFGIGLAVSYLTGKSFNLLAKSRQDRVDEYFETILADIE